MNIFEIKKTKYISHRGFTPMAPENSLPSFYYAGLLGQWAIETDFHTTKDGEVVCCHDEKIDNYCTENGKISDMTYSEILKCPIINGNRIDCFSIEERRIPKLSEYLGICRRFGSIPFIELKEDDVEYVIHCLHKYGFSDKEFVASSGSLARLKECRRISKDIFVHWIFAKEDRLSELASLGNAGLSFNIPNAFDCSEEKIKSVHDMGLKVCLRAADRLESFDYMKKLSLDYFPTNTMHDKI